MTIDVAIGRTPTGGRAFPLGFRVEFLRQWDECVERGAKTALLREHNLTQNTVKRWIHARDNGEWTTAMVDAANASKNAMTNRERAELARLRRENDQLKKKVEQSEAVQEILGKAYELLEGMHTSSQDEGTDIPISLMSATEYAEWLRRNRLS
ncbi:hypothetical protein CH300_03010 [Rhodococcus sp. 15-1154-1]|nr:hypothetical protein [Rhodococcus sp. 15-1154-1]OZF08903.1 hypothetical protein CH300_03010 [Rhodococcus sp. 15-1154-1]